MPLSSPRMTDRRRSPGPIARLPVGTCAVAALSDARDGTSLKVLTDSLQQAESDELTTGEPSLLPDDPSGAGLTPTASVHP